MSLKKKKGPYHLKICNEIVTDKWYDVWFLKTEKVGGSIAETELARSCW